MSLSGQARSEQRTNNVLNRRPLKMTDSIHEIKRPIRRRLKRTLQKSRDARLCRPANAILLLHQAYTKAEVVRLLSASRTRVRSWAKRFIHYGEAGLLSESPGRAPTTVSDTLCHHLLHLIQQAPGDYGFQRTPWTSEMLAQQLQTDFTPLIHASSIRRLLPTLCINDPHKARKWT